MKTETQEWKAYKAKCAANPAPKVVRAKLSADRQLLLDCRNAMAETLGDWLCPDSPEALTYSMKAMQNLNDRINARLGL